MGFENWSCKERENEKYGRGDMRRWYQRDIDQITHSTAFRKLQHKSQLLSEKDPRSRSRMIHTIEVSRIAMEVAEKLNVSKELTEAISYAHDIATAPYGYIGNEYLQNKIGSSYSHELAGALQLLNLSKKPCDDETIIDNIESELNRGKNAVTIQSDDYPFNLCGSKYNSDEKEDVYYIHHISPEIIDGVFNHGGRGVPQTIEGQIVQFADNIAYLSQDIEDLLSTKIITPGDYTKNSARALKCKVGDKLTDIPWSKIDDEKWGSLKEAFNRTRGRRVAAFINRFVNYNQEMLEDKKLKERCSNILGKDIPVLQIDSGMQYVIDFIWSFTESKYEDALIKTSNEIQHQKMEQLWYILHEKRFTSKNTSFANFINDISHNSLFSNYDDNWKIAYFISHLSYKEVDLIIDSFHERNYTFDIDIKEI